MSAKRILTHVSPKAASGFKKVLELSGADYGIKRDAKTGEFVVAFRADTKGEGREAVRAIVSAGKIGKNRGYFTVKRTTSGGFVGQKKHRHTTKVEA